MPTPSDQLLELIDAAIARRAPTDDPIGGGRLLFLEHLKSKLADHGFPLPDEHRLDACSIPYIFQELNYDGYDWSLRTEDLGHLADIVDIDVIVWSGGRSRAELTDSEYNTYIDFCHTAIKHRSNR